MCYRSYMGEQEVMMVKVSEFMIGLIFCGFIIAVFGLYIGEMNTTYGGADYDNESLEVYNQLDDMSTLTEQLEEGSEIKEKTGVLDIIGGYFTDAYNVLKLTKTSFNTFDTMSNQAIEDANIGKAGRLLRVAVSAVVLILIIVGVIISAIIKRDL